MIALKIDYIRISGGIDIRYMMIISSGSLKMVGENLSSRRGNDDILIPPLVVKGHLNAGVLFLYCALV